MLDAIRSFSTRFALELDDMARGGSRPLATRATAQGAAAMLRLTMQYSRILESIVAKLLKVARSAVNF
jgi:hypothetical protein